MKKLAVLFLLLSGCSSVPYSIEMVNIHDTLEIQRGELKGCTINLETITTKAMNQHGSMSDWVGVCGQTECPNDTRFTYEKGACLDFEAVRLDRKSSERLIERSGPRNRD